MAKELAKSYTLENFDGFLTPGDDYSTVKIPDSVCMGHVLNIIRTYDWQTDKKNRTSANENLERLFKRLFPNVHHDRTGSELLIVIRHAVRRIYSNGKFVAKVRAEDVEETRTWLATDYLLKFCEQLKVDPPVGGEVNTPQKRRSRHQSSDSGKRLRTTETQSSVTQTAVTPSTSSAAIIDRLRSENNQLKEALRQAEDRVLELDETVRALESPHHSDTPEGGSRSKSTPTPEQLVSSRKKKRRVADSQHPVTDLPWRPLSLRQTTAPLSPYFPEVVMLFVLLCMEKRLSIRQAIDAFGAIAEFFHFHLDGIPSLGSICQWLSIAPVVNRYMAMEEILNSSGPITVGADKTTMRMSNSYKLPFLSSVIHTSSGSTSLPIAPMASSTGMDAAKRMIDTLQDMAEIHSSMAALNSDDSDGTIIDKVQIVAESRKKVNDIISRVSSLIADGGSDNRTFGYYLDAWKTELINDREGFENKTEDEKFEDLALLYAEKQKAAIKNGRGELVVVHCVLHVVSLFAKHFLSTADKQFPVTEELGPHYFSQRMQLVLALFESRSDSHTSVGELFHATIEEHLTRYNTFWNSARCRDYSILVDCGVIAYWHNEIIKFLQNSYEGLPQPEKCYNVLQFLKDKSVVAILQVGGIMFHAVLLPLWDKAEKIKGAAGLQVQSVFAAYMNTLLADDDAVRNLLTGNSDFADSIGYKGQERQQNVIRKIVLQNPNAYEMKFAKELTMQICEQNKKYTSNWLPRFLGAEGETVKEQLVADVANAPGTSSMAEGNFGTASTNRKSGGSVATIVDRTHTQHGHFVSRFLKLPNSIRLLKNVRALAPKQKKKSNADNKKARDQLLEGIQRKHKRAENFNAEKIHNFVESLTSNIELCPGNLWRSKDHMDFVLRQRFGNRANASEKQIKLEMLRLQVRFWRNAVPAETYRDMQTVGIKDNEELDENACKKFLQSIWKKEQFSNLLGSDVIGEAIEMRFKDNDGSMLPPARGVVTGTIRWRADRRWLFVKFPLDPEPESKDATYVYDLQHELAADNIVNKDKFIHLLPAGMTTGPSSADEAEEPVVDDEPH